MARPIHSARLRSEVLMAAELVSGQMRQPLPALGMVKGR